MRIIVFALRGCPVAALGPYGNEWIATPNLDRFAAEGVVFDAHVSDCPDPAAAGRAWRTGRHQVPPIDPGTASTSPANDLLAVLKARSVRTYLLRNTREANDAHADFYVGWDELFDARPDPADRSPADALFRALPAVLDRLAESADWLLWIEIDHLLPPWVVRQDVFDVYVEDLLEDDSEQAAEDSDEPDEAGDEPADVEPDPEFDEEPEPEIEEPEVEPVQPWADPPRCRRSCPGGCSRSPSWRGSAWPPNAAVRGWGGRCW
ncbi:MAG TPA: hypothetical protein VM533_13675, partial [Fimbriiglobus sp.]|nr:hypothetical protein [Fimbriiglobus sp.]